MHKRIAVKTMLCMLLVVFTMSGCSQENSNADIQAPVTEPTIVEKIVEVEKEVFVEVEKEVPVEVPVFSYMTAEEPEVKIERSTGSYLATVQGQYDDIAYIGHQFKPKWKADTWSSLTPELMTISENYAYTGTFDVWAEGLAQITDGENIYTIACTTVNDGKVVEVISTSEYDRHEYRILNQPYIYAYTYWQEEIDSVKEFLFWTNTQWFTYEDNVSQCTDKWVGYGHPRTIYETKAGVCGNVASLACGILQYDYEEVGVVFVSAYGYGHAYNYVFEDGYYYIFDAVSLFSPYGQEAYKDIEIKKCADIDEVQTYCLNHFGLDDKTIEENIISIYLADSEHMGIAPYTYTSFHNDQPYAAFEKGASNGLEEGFSYELVWSNPNIDYELYSVPSEQVVADGCESFFLYK